MRSFLERQKEKMGSIETTRVEAITPTANSISKTEDQKVIKDIEDINLVFQPTDRPKRN